MTEDAPVTAAALLRRGARRPVAGSPSAFAGTLRMARLVLRRDRVRLPAWVLSITTLVLGSVATFTSTYPGPAELQARGDLIGRNTPAQLFTGPGYGSDHYTYGAMTANELLPMAALAVAFMSVFLIVRYTRAEEESGRSELLRATAVGRHAPIAAAVLVTMAANVVIGVILGVGLPASLSQLDGAGSWAFAGAVTGAGMTFVGVGLLAAQLSATARDAVTLATLAIGVLYLLRGVGDILGWPLAWLSPFGWASEMRAYVDERWWPLLLDVALTAMLLVAAAAISVRRDVGAGILANRPRRLTTRLRLGTPFGLALRLHRTQLLAWSIPLFLMAALYGSLAGEASGLYDDNDVIKDYLARMGGADTAGQLVAMYLSFLTIAATGFAIQTVSQLRAEEAGGRVEPMLAAPVSRARLLFSHVAVAVTGLPVIATAIGLGGGLTRAISVSDASEIPRTIGAALVYVPAQWVFAGATALLFAVLPRATATAWALFAAAIVIAFLGPLLNLPDWAARLSPFTHSPHLPAEHFTATPLIAMTAIAAAFIAGSAVAFRRRDIEA